MYVFMFKIIAQDQSKMNVNCYVSLAGISLRVRVPVSHIWQLLRDINSYQEIGGHLPCLLLETETFLLIVNLGDITIPSVSLWTVLGVI